ncbi:hypothetical protein D3C87_1876700 [compost metagenome]
MSRHGLQFKFFDFLYSYIKKLGGFGDVLDRMMMARVLFREGIYLAEGDLHDILQYGVDLVEH